jgi:regulator of protease activity HflC (stomatin/prohibitin superfamily)
MNRQEQEQKTVRFVKRVVATVASIVVASVLWFSFTETVSQGHVGVVFNKMQGGVQEETLTEGLNFVMPLSRISEYPTSLETVKYKMSLPTADTKTITFPITFDYHNDPAKVASIYREWRGQAPEDLEKGFLRTKMVSIASDITAKYTILQLNVNRAEIQTQILTEFTKTVEAKGFLVSSVTLGTPEYDAETSVAIQQVVNKQQELKSLEIEKQKTKLEAERKVIEAKGVADSAIETARGKAESTKLQADAQAKANKLLNASLTENVLKKMELDARQSHGWITIQGATPLVEAK